MKHIIQNILQWIIHYKKGIIITASSLVGAAIIIVGVVLIVIANTPKVVYQPANACDLLTLDEAKQLLGPQAFNGVNKPAVVNKNLAASSCGYSDLNTDENSTIVAAVSVRSGVNDKGVAQNELDYVANKPKSGTQDISGIGDSAYFNEGLGQLNIIANGGKRLIIVSYGVGSTPQANTTADVIKLARLVLN